MSNARPFVRSFFVVVLLATVFSFAALAQDEAPVNRLILSEDQINTALRAGIQDPNTDFFLDFQPGQMLVNLVVTGQRGNTSTFVLTLVPSVVNGELVFDATSLTLNGFEIPINNDNAAISGATNSVSGFLGEQTGGGQVQSVTVTDAQVILEWASANPNDPTLTIQDNLLSVTFTEASINAMEWVTNPTGEFTSAINVDLQGGQAVINTSRTVNPTTVDYVIVPVVVNDNVVWQFTSSANAESGIASSLVSYWQAVFNEIYGANILVNAVIADNLITFTWDLTTLNEAQAGDPVVTYTFSESEINTIFDLYETGELTDLSVDIQPEQVVINATGMDESNVYMASVALAPELANGALVWSIASVNFNWIVLDETTLQSDSGVAESLVSGFNAHQSDATVIDFELTDSEMTVTVRYR